MEPCKREVEEFMLCFYNTLSEKDKRRYAAVEAKKRCKNLLMKLT